MKTILSYKDCIKSFLRKETPVFECRDLAISNHYSPFLKSIEQGVVSEEIINELLNSNYPEIRIYGVHYCNNIECIDKLIETEKDVNVLAEIATKCSSDILTELINYNKSIIDCGCVRNDNLSVEQLTSILNRKEYLTYCNIARFSRYIGRALIKDLTEVFDDLELKYFSIRNSKLKLEIAQDLLGELLGNSYAMEAYLMRVNEFDYYCNKILEYIDQDDYIDLCKLVITKFPLESSTKFYKEGVKFINARNYRE